MVEASGHASEQTNGKSQNAEDGVDVRASGGRSRDAAGGGNSGAVQEKEAAAEVSLRFVTLPGAGMGRAKSGARGRRGADQANCGLRTADCGVGQAEDLEGARQRDSQTKDGDFRLPKPAAAHLRAV